MKLYKKKTSLVGFAAVSPSSALSSGGLVSSPHQPASTFSSSVPPAASLTAISLHRCRHQRHYNLSLCLSKHFHGHCVGIPGAQTGLFPLSLPPSRSLPLSPFPSFSVTLVKIHITLCNRGYGRSPLVAPPASRLCPALVTHSRPAAPSSCTFTQLARH